MELILFPLILYFSPDRFWYPYINFTTTFFSPNNGEIKKVIWPEGNQIFIKSVWFFGQNISKWGLPKDFGWPPSFHTDYPPYLHPCVVPLAMIFYDFQKVHCSSCVPGGCRSRPTITKTVWNSIFHFPTGSFKYDQMYNCSNAMHVKLANYLKTFWDACSCHMYPYLTLTWYDYKNVSLLDV